MDYDKDSTFQDDSALDVKEEAAVELACTIGFGAADKLKEQFSKATNQGLSKDDLAAIVSKAMCVKNNARDLINKTAHQSIGQGVDVIDCCKDEEVTRLKEIAAIASAVGTNSSANYQKHLAIGKEVGLSNEAISEITKKAFDIKMQLFWDFKDDIYYPDGSSESKHSHDGGCCSDKDSCDTSCKPGEASSNGNSKKDDAGCC